MGSGSIGGGVSKMSDAKIGLVRSEEGDVRVSLYEPASEQQEEIDVYSVWDEEREQGDKHLD